MKRILLIFIVFSLLISHAWAGMLVGSGGVDGTIPANDKYWVNNSGAGDNSWNDADNWASSASGAGGAGVPDSGSTVYFDGTDDDDNCTVDVAIDIAELNVQSGYSGTLDFATYNTDVAGDVTFAGTGEVDLGTGTITVSGDLDNNEQTTFTSGTSTVVLDGTSKDFKAKFASGTSFYNVTIPGSYTLTKGNGSVLFIKGDFVLSGTLLNTPNATISLYDSSATALIEDSATFNVYRIRTYYTNTITIENGASYTGGFYIGGDSTLTSTGGTATITGFMTVAASKDLAFTGDFNMTGNFDAAAGCEVTGAVDLEVGGNLAIVGTDVSGSVWNGPDLDVTGTATATYTTITDSDGKTGTGTTPTADNTCTDGTGNTNWTFE